MEPLEPTADFTYLGRTITYNNRDWEAVYHNTWKARRRWGMISKVLIKTEATVQDQGMFYKAVDCTVLIYGSDS